MDAAVFCHGITYMRRLVLRLGRVYTGGHICGWPFCLRATYARLKVREWHGSVR